MLICATASVAQNGEIFVTDKGAISGYDAVAYFTEGKPVIGLDPLTYQWKNEVWHFSSQKNLDLFKQTPEKYAPQYGGYCAFGMSRGYKAKTDPAAWTIAEGKLYLNYNMDVRGDWAKNQKALIEKADKNWPTLKAKE